MRLHSDIPTFLIKEGDNGANGFWFQNLIVILVAKKSEDFLATDHTQVASCLPFC